MCYAGALQQKALLLLPCQLGLSGPVKRPRERGRKSIGKKKKNIGLERATPDSRPAAAVATSFTSRERLMWRLHF